MGLRQNAAPHLDKSELRRRSNEVIAMENCFAGRRDGNRLHRHGDCTGENHNRRIERRRYHAEQGGERGEIVYVSGNDVVIKMEDGEIRHFPNVSERTRVEVDGQMLSVHEVKPGMKVSRTITTTTTPKTVTTVQTVTGKVWFVTPPSSVILTLENGQNQAFKIPKGQKFNVDGQMGRRIPSQEGHENLSNQNR
jgi:hypothetical protein